MVSRIKKIKLATWIKFFIGLALVVSFGFLLWRGPLRDFVQIDKLVAWVGFMKSNGFSIAMFYCVFVLAVLGLPLTMFPIIGGVLFNFWIALPLNLLATTLGAWIAFAIARVFGRDAVELMLRGRLKKIDRLTEVKGFKTVVVLRWVGIPPFIFANYALGLSRVRLRDYLLGTIVGLLPWMGIVTYAANAIWQSVLERGDKGLAMALASRLWPLMVLSLVVSVVFVAMWLRQRNRKENQAAAES